MRDEVNPSTREVLRESAVAEALAGDLDLYQDLREKDFSMECQDREGGTVWSVWGQDPGYGGP